MNVRGQGAVDEEKKGESFSSVVGKGDSVQLFRLFQLISSFLPSPSSTCDFPFPFTSQSPHPPLRPTLPHTPVTPSRSTTRVGFLRYIIVKDNIYYRKANAVRKNYVVEHLPRYLPDICKSSAPVTAFSKVKRQIVIKQQGILQVPFLLFVLAT